jgi:hypothetical protein
VASAASTACIGQLRAEPGGGFQDLRKLLVLSERLVDVAADTVSGVAWA